MKLKLYIYNEDQGILTVILVYFVLPLENVFYLLYMSQLHFN